MNSSYLFVISKEHCTLVRNDVCLKEYMNLSPRLRSGTTSKDTKPMRRTRSRSQKNLNNTHIFLNTTKYKIGYNLALTKDSHIFYSRSTIY